jgi:hypothetical protein
MASQDAAAEDQDHVFSFLAGARTPRQDNITNQIYQFPPEKSTVFSGGREVAVFH